MMNVRDVFAALLIGVAGGVITHWLVGLKWWRAVATGVLFAALTGVLVSVRAPSTITDVNWCRTAVGNARITGQLRAVAFGGLPENASVQVKIYEPGRGDPPLTGPTYAQTDVTGAFSLAVAPVAELQAYVLNIAYSFESWLGERWAIQDFRMPTPEACPENITTG
jgi:hypothetical protein